MARTLILIRHAKSDWSAGASSDHARPLNARGRAAAPLVGTALADRGVTPDEVLCSTATRARETWDLIALALPSAPEPEYAHGLYMAEPDAMLDRLAATQGQTVALIGHNPGLCALAHDLAGAAVKHPRFGTYPTGATLILSVDAWEALGSCPPKLVDFFVPRDLPGHP